MNAKLKAGRRPSLAADIDDRWFNEYLPQHPDAIRTALDRLMALENYYRRAAGCRGYILRKSRARKWSTHNHRAYMILNTDQTVAVGKDYDLSLDEVAKFLKSKERA